MYATWCSRSSFDVTPEAVRRAQRRAFAAPRRHLMVVASGIKFVELAGTRLLAQEARRRRALRGGLYFLA